MASERQIHCCKCNDYVGTIRDAKLKKGLLFICPSCLESITKQTATTYNDYHADAFDDLFQNSLFDDIFGKDIMCD